MRPTGSHAAAHAGTGTEDIAMSLDQDSLAHIMQVLTDLYSDPIGAVVREYSTNALDSHLEAGNPDPIEVTLPTTDSPTFVVRDRGVGLSVDELRDVYSRYGKSTKRDSDDYTGMLGLGCKSALTYALSFTVEAVKNGVRAVAVVSRDSGGVGAIKVLDTSATDEPNGVTVSVPVGRFDTPVFRDRAEDLYRYWREGEVLVDGGPPKGLPPTAVWVDADMAIGPSGTGHSVVVMGRVPYRINNPHKFPYRVTAWVPIGSVDFTPSREALHQTALSADTVATVFQYARDTLSRHLLAAVEDAATPYERARLISAWSPAALAGDDRFKVRALEAQTRVAIPNGRRAFHYNGRRSLGHQGMGWVRMEDVGDERVAIVTGFPLKSVTAQHRAKLEAVVGGGWILLPDGCDARMLEGRPNVTTWQEVLELAPVVPRAAGGGRSPTRYAAWIDGKKVTVQDAPPGTPLYWEYKGEARGFTLLKGAVAEILPAQQDRFLRLYPGTERARTALDRLRKETLAKVTEDDRLVDSPCYLAKGLSRLSDRIDDPELARAAKAAGPSGRLSAAATEAKRMHMSLGLPTLSATLEERYPLVTAAADSLRGSLDKTVAEDALAYVNAKYAATPKTETEKET